MLNGTHQDNVTEPGPLADWRQWLETDPLLSPGLRESYRRTLEGFEQFCRKRPGAQAPSGGAAASARPSVGLAREYVELQRLERGPGPAQLQEWKDALNWLFRCRRAQRSGVLTGVPPLGRADLGRTPWERRLVETIRVPPLTRLVPLSSKAITRRFTSYCTALIQLLHSSCTALARLLHGSYTALPGPPQSRARSS